MKSHPIGVLDSGKGGLTVLREIMTLLPKENTIYYADAGNCPYGPKPIRQVQQLVRTAVEFLLAKGCKLIVIACNTATAAAIELLRAEYGVPFVGMEPALKPAVQSSQTGTVGILATKGTIEGSIFNRTREKYGKQARIITCIGDGLVELVEDGREHSPEAMELISHYLEPMMVEGADRIVLGCTHYPFLWPALEHTIGNRPVQIIDPAPAVARRTLELLTEKGLLNPGDDAPYHLYFSSADEPYTASLPEKLQQLRQRV